MMMSHDDVTMSDRKGTPVSLLAFFSSFLLQYSLLFFSSPLLLLRTLTCVLILRSAKSGVVRSVASSFPRIDRSVPATAIEYPRPAATSTNEGRKEEV